MKTRKNPFLRPASFAAALVLCALPAHAGTLYWDGTTSTANADGGNGTWDNGTTLNWDTLATAGADSVWTNANNDTAVFGGAVGTVSLGGGIQVGGLQFDTAGYLIQSDTLTFGTSGNIVTNADATINSALATTGASVITKTGSGILTLGGNNTYAGNTTISDGTLKAGSTTGLSANSAFSVATGATLDLGGFNNTIKSLSTATGAITNSTGNATLTISTMAQTAQLFSGDLALKFASNQINSSILTNTANTFSGGITIGSTVTNDRFLLGGTTIGAGTPGALTNGVWGTGALTLGVTAADRAQILFLGGVTINNAIVVNSAVGNTDAAGAFRVDGGSNVINGAINANLAAANFRNGGSGAGGINVTGAISGNSGLTLLAGNGTGTLNVTLTSAANANTYAGDTTISSVKETLTLGASDQISNGTGKGNLIVTGGTFRMGGFSETINGLSGTGTVDGVSGTPTLTVGDNDATSAYSGVIQNTAGALALTKTGSGTLTLSGNNTYGGATTVSVGTLKAGSITGLSASSAHSVATGSILDLGGFNNTIKSLSTSGGTITNSTGNGTLKIADAMGGTLTSHLFTGSLGLQLFGGNTVNTILSNTANDYSGGTILGNGSGAINTRILLSGTVGAGSPGAVTSGIFGTGAITIGAATTDRSQFYFAGATTINNAFVVNSSQGDGAQFGAFRHEAPGSNVVIAGTVNANLADVMVLSANGNTTRTLSFTNTISGNSGLQVLTQASAILNVTLNNAGTANSYAGNTTIGTANSSLTLGAANQIPNGAGKGNLIVTAGKFNMGGFNETINGLSGTGTVDGTSGTPTLTVGDNNATSTFSGVIQNTGGALALTKTGSGTLTLSGANTYSGATLISGGTLELDATGTINGTSEVSLGTGGTLDVTLKGLSGYTVGTLTGSGNVTGALTVSTQLAIGNSPGTTNFSSNLTLGALSTYLHDLTGGAAPGLNSADLGDIAGDLTITAGSILDLVQLGTYTANNKFTLFAYDGTFSGTFKDTFSNVLADGATFTDAGGIWMIDYNDTTAGANGGVSASNTYVTITAIPEPNFAALVGGLGVLALLRRRR